VATFRGAAPVIAVLGITAALALAAATTATWSRSSTDMGDKVVPILETTLVRVRECFGGDPCRIRWLGAPHPKNPPDPFDAIWAGRFALVGSIVTAGSLLVVGLLALRRRRDEIASCGAIAGAGVVLGSSAWYVTSIPELTVAPAVLGIGPWLAIGGAIVAVTTASWARGLRRARVPEARALRE
jgi:hypothetical protein